MQGAPAVEGAAAGDVFDPAAVGDEALLGHHLLEGVGVELGEAPLLGDVDLGGGKGGVKGVGDPPGGVNGVFMGVLGGSEGLMGA